MENLSSIILVVAVFFGVIWFLCHERKESPLIGKQILEIHLIIDDDTTIASIIKNLKAQKASRPLGRILF